MNTSKNDWNITTIIILCTLPNDTELSIKLTKILLQTKLAACITLIKDVHSFYYWNKELKNDIELQLLIKTKKSLEKLVFHKIKELHPYKVPELLTIPIINGEFHYLQWIHSMLNQYK